MPEIRFDPRDHIWGSNRVDQSCLCLCHTNTHHALRLAVQDLQLVWQAAVSRAPVTLTVARFGPLSGMVCSLDEQGVLSASYQGTDPPTSAVVAADVKEIDYEEINQEHRSLLQVRVLLL